MGPRAFPNRTVAKTYMSTEILNGYDVGDEISNPEHVAILNDLLRRKPSEAEKVGPGIDHWFVDLTSNYRDYVRKDARTIAIRQTDGTRMDFGYTKVIDEGGHVDDVKEALRYAVQDKRDAIKFGAFDSPPVVDEQGDVIADPSECEVRYTGPTWGELTADFADSLGGWDNIETHSGQGVAQVGQRLSSEEVSDRWREYYDDHAVPHITRKRPGYI